MIRERKWILRLMVMGLLVVWVEKEEGWAIWISRTSFQVNLADVGANHRVVFVFDVNEEGGMTIHVVSFAPGKIVSYEITIGSDGTITEMWRFNKQLHGEEALGELTKITLWLGAILDSKTIPIGPILGNGKDMKYVNKIEALESLQRWYDHFYHYIPKTPGIWGNIKNSKEDEVRDLKETRKEAIEGRNATIPVMAIEDRGMGGGG